MYLFAFAPMRRTRLNAVWRLDFFRSFWFRKIFWATAIKSPANAKELFSCDPSFRDKSFIYRNGLLYNMCDLRFSLSPLIRIYLNKSIPAAISAAASMKASILPGSRKARKTPAAKDTAAIPITWRIHTQRIMIISSVFLYSVFNYMRRHMRMITYKHAKNGRQGAEYYFFNQRFLLSDSFFNIAWYDYAVCGRGLTLICRPCEP